MATDLQDLRWHCIEKGKILEITFPNTSVNTVSAI